MHHTLRVGFAGLAACLMAGVSAPALADLRAVIVGIDDYAHIEPLDGAVNDARDMADALRAAGATDVRMLLDQAASRDAIFQAWADVLARSKPGDLVVLSYAGHGGRSPERVPGSERTGMDSELLLAGFTPQAPGNYERIVDDEINVMLKRATDAGLAVLMAVDACHSGTMTRGFDTRVSTRKVRAAPHGPIVDDRLPPADPVAAAIQPVELPNVLSLGAVQDEELAPEVILDGQPRGALSWSLARGLRGEADLNRDGVITEEELQLYVRESIRIVMAGQQHPSILRSRGARDTFFKIIGQGVKEGTKKILEGAATEAGKKVYNAASEWIEKKWAASADWPDRLNLTSHITPLKLRIINVGAQPAEHLTARLGTDAVTLVQDATAADLTWDVQAGEVLNSRHDLVAYTVDRVRGAMPATRAFTRVGPAVEGAMPVSHVAPADGGAQLAKLRGIVDKWRLIPVLEEHAIRSLLSLTLQPGDRYHRMGETVTLTVSGIRHRHFALLDVASDGSVIVLYPQTDKERTALEPGRSLALTLRVEPPFGSDHFVAVAGDQPLDAMIADLNGRAGRPAALDLAELLERYLNGQPHQIGLHSVYTAAWTP